MTRQEQVTEAQVRHKIAEARGRAADGMRESRRATYGSPAYRSAIRKVKKAANDMAAWKVVLASLGRPTI